jgi:hypothetical protein
MPLGKSTGNICPVCGYDGLLEPAYDEHGCASYEICPCCGTEFGYQDFSTPHATLRAKWIAEGMRWRSSVDPLPDQWDPVRQLVNVSVSA